MNINININIRTGIRRITAAIACAAMLATLAGCSKKDKPDISNPQGESTVSGSGGIGVTPPDNYVDNTPSDPLAYTNEELYSAIGGVDNAAIRDERVYMNGEGFQYRLTSNLLTTAGIESDAARISDMAADIDKIVIGGKEYAYGDLIRDKTQGIEVARMLARDFGVNICDDTGRLVERKGDIEDIDALRNAYSDRIEYDEYTACAYYFDAAMNDLDDEIYARYREKYNDKHGVDAGEQLDGVFGLILYYDTEGHDYFYSVVISAPTYYSDEKNFDANMDTNIRKDATNCHIRLKDGLKIGFVNRVTIMCADMPDADISNSGA